MKRRNTGWLFGLLLLSGAARAEEPHLGYFFPAGARAGATTEIVAGGQWLENASGLHVSGRGIEARVAKWFKELSPQEINSLRNRLEAHVQNLEKAQGDERTKLEKEIREIQDTLAEQGWDETGRKRLKPFDPRRQLNPQIREQVTIALKVAPDAPPGPREIRVITPEGLSNPMVFWVGAAGELLELEPNDREVPDGAPVLARGAVYNGRIMPGDVDCIRVPMDKGEAVRFTVQARALIPYLADAVPGWFQAVLTLRDPSGKQVACVDDNLFDPDPVLSYTAPQAGDYILEIRDAIYRGREDFVYRIGRSGPAKSPAPAGARPGELEEKEPNDSAAQAMTLPPGVTAFGRIGKAGDCDVWRIQGEAGRKLVAEVRARRLGSPLDALLQLRDASGKSLAVQDDSVDRRQGLITHHADAEIAFSIPAGGTCFLEVRDLQQRGGEAFAYQLVTRPEQPGFDLRLTPASINVAAGGSAPVTVHLLRRDGYGGPVRLHLPGAPPGWRLDGGEIPPGADRVRCTLTVPRNTPSGTHPLKMEGLARIGEREVRQLAQPAEDMMQAFLYRHLVRVEQSLVTVTGPAPLALVVPEPSPPGGGLVRIPAGGSAKVILETLGGGKKNRREMKLELSEPPPGIRLGGVLLPEGQSRVEITVQADAGEAKAGFRGNLILQVLRGKKILCTAPAIPFEITAPAP